MIYARLAMGALVLVSSAAAMAAARTPEDYIDKARRMLDPDRTHSHAPHGDGALIPNPGLSFYTPREHVRGFELGSADVELATFNIRRGMKGGDIAAANVTRAHARGATFSVRDSLDSAIDLTSDVSFQQLRERAAGSSVAARPNDIRDTSIGLKLTPRGWPALSIRAEHLAVASRPSDFDRMALLGTTPVIPGDALRLGLSGGKSGRGQVNWNLSLRTLRPRNAGVDAVAPGYSGQVRTATIGLHMAF